MNLGFLEILRSLQPKRVVLDLLSDVLLRHKALVTRKWLTEQLQRLRSLNITTLAVLNPYMHGSEEVQAVIDLFDGNLEIIENKAGKNRGKFIHINWMHGVDIEEKELAISDLVSQVQHTKPRRSNALRGGAGADRRRIAVLPCLNISKDPADQYFSDGLTEELISRLSTVSGLRVIARTSVMRFKGSSKSVNEIGTELGSGSLLEGSVRKADNRLRIATRLIDVPSEEHVWAQDFDKQLEDVFAIQIELATRVTEALKTQLLAEDKLKLQKKPTVDFDAYTLYLKGKFAWNERSRDSLNRAVKCFEDALERDPEFALAYSGLADCYIVLVDHGYMGQKQGYTKAREALLRALALDSTLAEAHSSLGNILSNEWKWAAAEAEFVKALKNNLSYAKAHHWYSIHLLGLGRLEEAIGQLKIAEELDPASPMIHAYAGGLYIYARRYDDAMKELDKSLQLDPYFVPAHANRSDACLSKAMFSEAITELEWVLPRVPETTQWKVERGFVYALSGRKDDAARLAREVEAAPDYEQLEPQRLAVIYSKLGNMDRALKLIERAFELHSITPFQVRQSQFYDTINSDPRFEELFKKATQSTEAVANPEES